MDCSFCAWQLVTPAAILITGITGAIIAIWSILSAREVARKKAAMDFLLSSFDNIIYKEAYNTIRKLHLSSETEIEKFAYEQGLDDDGIKSRTNISQVHIQMLLAD